MAAELLTAVRHTPERLLHRWRRRAAHTAARRSHAPGTVLVLCYGNICRSPFASAILARCLAPAGVLVESAGLMGPGRPAPADAVRAAGAYSVDLSRHRSRLVTTELVRDADLVVVMDEAQRRSVSERFGLPAAAVLLLGDFDPAPIRTRGIRDPINQPLHVFTQVYARIARCARSLASQVLRVAPGPVAGGPDARVRLAP